MTDEEIHDYTTLDNAIQAYWELEKQRQESTALLRRKIAALNHEIEVAERPIKACQEALRSNIEDEILAIKMSHKTQFATVKYTRPYEKAKWDSEKLLALAQDYPCIMVARDLTPVPASVSIKLNID